MSAGKIRDRYLELGDEVFPATGASLRNLLQWFRAVWSPSKLEVMLADIFGDRQLGEAGTRLVIPSFNAVDGDVHLFKTAHHPRFTRDYKELVREVALATSAAPTYCPIFTQQGGNRFVDGGVWANNPVAVAVNEAIGILGCEPQSVEVLSIGTTSEPFHVPEEKNAAGKLGWLKDGTIVRLVSAAQDAGALGLARTITGHEERLLRIDPKTTRGRFNLDDSTSIEELRALGAQAARHAEPEVRRRFLDAQAPAFHPYHSL
jgi:patatin-like phospholipase/acyl hydrolase